MERARGFEPLTASLEGWNSTTELRPHTLSVLSTESSVLSSETTPRRRISALSTRHSALLRSLEALNLRTQLIETSGSSKLGMVGRQGFEPWKPMATDLQSAPFVHLGTCPNIAKSLDSSLWAQKQTIPLTVPPLSNDPAGDDCFRMDTSAILEAGNFTNDVAICQVG